MSDATGTQPTLTRPFYRNIGQHACRNWVDGDEYLGGVALAARSLCTAGRVERNLD